MLLAAVARWINQVNVEFLPKGLHDMGQAGMSGRLKEVLAAVDQGRYDAIVLGYALCSNGLVGIKAERIPLRSFPAAHDCITLFLGSKRAVPSNTFSRTRASFRKPPAGSSGARV